MMILIQEVIKKYHKIAKFLITGGAAATISFSILYIFTDIFGFWYLISSVIAFIFAVTFNFIAQKNWVFKNKQEKGARRQIILFFIVSLGNLAVNSLGMYLLVEKVGLWYMLAQFLMTGGQAIVNFFVYRRVVFREKIEI